MVQCLSWPSSFRWWIGEREALCAKWASQQATKHRSHQHAHQELLNEQAQGTGRHKGSGRSTGALLEHLDRGKHPLFVTMERLLAIGGFVQGTSQQIGSSHRQRGPLPRDQREAVAGIAEEGHSALMPGGHLNLDHRIHEHGSLWADIGEEPLSQPTHPREHLAQMCQSLFAWQMLRLRALIQEQDEEFALGIRAIGKDLSSWLVIQLVGAANAVAVGKRVTGDSVAQIATELLFWSEDQSTRGRMHAIGTNQQIKRLGRAVIECCDHRIRARFYALDPTTKPHLHAPLQRFIQHFFERRVHQSHVFPVADGAKQCRIQPGDWLASLVHIDERFIGNLPGAQVVDQAHSGSDIAPSGYSRSAHRYRHWRWFRDRSHFPCPTWW